MLWVPPFGEIGTLRTSKVHPETLAPWGENLIHMDIWLHDVNFAGNVRVTDTSPNLLTRSSPRGKLGGVMEGVPV